MRRITPLFLAAAILSGCSRSDQSSNQPSSADNSGIIFRDASGKALTLADLQTNTGTVKWQSGTDKPVPDEANALHDKARELQASGQLDQAAEMLKEAAAIAPDWAYPPYDLAYTYLLQGRSEEALDLYRKVDQLQPRGFFTAKTALWSLEREKDSIFPKGTYLSYLKIESLQTNSDKAQLALQIVQQAPTFSPALKTLALLTPDPKTKMALIDRALAAGTDGETYGVLMVNKAAILNALGNHDEAIRILGGLALSPDSTSGTVALARVMLSSIVKHQEQNQPPSQSAGG